MADVLRTVEAVAGTGVAVLVMTYWNPVDHYGVEGFARDLAAAEESLDPVFLVAPSSSRQRKWSVTWPLTWPPGSAAANRHADFWASGLRLAC